MHALDALSCASRLRKILFIFFFFEFFFQGLFLGKKPFDLSSQLLKRSPQMDEPCLLYLKVRGPEERKSGSGRGGDDRGECR